MAPQELPTDVLTESSTALLLRYQTTRKRSEAICHPLSAEDCVIQPTVEVSPPKWHLAHTTWFWETFVLEPFLKGYKVFHAHYAFLFNSYYEAAGDRLMRTNRGNLSRPLLADIIAYRHHVDAHMQELLGHSDLQEQLAALVELGINHEEQHQELLYTDIKNIFGHNSLFPIYDQHNVEHNLSPVRQGASILLQAGLYTIGHQKDSFCFDNELGCHSVYLSDVRIEPSLVSHAEYLEFIDDKGYERHEFWHSDGWEWVKGLEQRTPLHWFRKAGRWMQYTLSGLQPLQLELPVAHVNFYEASAFAAWKGKRLLTEFEWEAASSHFAWGELWEWTQSAYLPYPGFKRAPGAVGEYNGKFMVNQMVLRGASVATSPGHSRSTYRNFFHAQNQWQYTGIRLCSEI